MRKFTILTALLLLLVVQITSAKGPPSRVLITGPTIDGEMVITEKDDKELMDELAMAYVTNFDLGIMTEPDDPGEGYHVVRQFGEEGDYTTFDSLTYYPGNDERRSLIFYNGIYNGGSSYDGNWYVPHAAGDAVLRRILFGDEMYPYLVLTHESGVVQIHDPDTLEEVARLETVVTGVNDVLGSYNGKSLMLFTDDEVLSFELSISCSATRTDWELPETTTIPDYFDPDRDDIKPFQITRQFVGYFLTNEPGEGDGGILMTEWRKKTTHTYTDYHFDDIIVAHYQYYGVHNNTDGMAELVQFDRLYEENILQRVRLDPGTWLLGYTALDLSEFTKSKHATCIIAA